MFGWFGKKGLRQGIFFAVMIYFIGSLNDVLMKVLGSRLHSVEIAFFRFFFSTIVVLIPMLNGRRELFKSQMHVAHITRGILGAIALGLCCFSVNVMPLAENTTILFSEALFMIPLTAIFLRERIHINSLIAIIIGFIGLMVMFKPKAGNINILAIVPTIAALLFAIMNIIIKKMVDNRENTLTMLFYFGLYTTIASGVVVPFFWKTPNFTELCFILLLGIGANLIQLFIFLAYRATSASSVSPVRYTELPFAVLFGFVFFSQIPDRSAFLGALLIICGTFVSSYSKARRPEKKNTIPTVNKISL